MALNIFPDIIMKHTDPKSAHSRRTSLQSAASTVASSECLTSVGERPSAARTAAEQVQQKKRRRPFTFCRPFP